ncbi:MAG: mannose-1-phosphate guanylyltransferase [Anaerolineaceae bacterium]|nr:mannose-1-phosphate guanylyltransferase [Anaerolineaceae bacterium]
MKNNYYAVIMAGGGGTRLWPLSRKSTPKQMLTLTNNRTMYQLACDRLKNLFPPERIFVVTVADQIEALSEQTPEIPNENFLIEPMPKGTATVVAYAASVLKKVDPDAVMAVLTADHLIENIAMFESVLNTAYDAAQSGYLVTLGIVPKFPSTGYGYIHRTNDEISGFDLPIYRVAQFREKPDLETAQCMLASGDYDWNSGMFIWRVAKILDAFETLMPELTEKMHYMFATNSSSETEQRIKGIWPKIKPQTIDYGIMEHAEDVVVIPAANLEWNDVGSWDSLFDVLQSDENCNIILGAEHLGIDTSESLVCSNQQDRLIVTIGVKDLVIVDTGDAILVSDRNRVQDVKEVVKKLLEQKKEAYL